MEIPEDDHKLKLLRVKKVRTIQGRFEIPKEMLDKYTERYRQ